MAAELRRRQGTAVKHGSVLGDGLEEEVRRGVIEEEAVPIGVLISTVGFGHRRQSRGGSERSGRVRTSCAQVGRWLTTRVGPTGQRPREASEREREADGRSPPVGALGRW